MLSLQNIACDRTFYFGNKYKSCMEYLNNTKMTFKYKILWYLKYLLSRYLVYNITQFYNIMTIISLYKLRFFAAIILFKK